jgi:phosphate uptake regulator
LKLYAIAKHLERVGDMAASIAADGGAHGQEAPVLPRPRPPATFFSLASQSAPLASSNSDPDLEVRLRELEQQFEEQRFQYE